jgi:hypothetical protein
MEPSGVTLSPRSRFDRSLRRARRARGAAIAVVLVVAGCQAPAVSGPTAGASTAASGSPSAAPTTTPTLADSGLFRIVGDGPVIARDIVPDRGAILPAAVTAADDGSYHAWVVAFAGTPGTQDIHHLTSPDAVTWTEVPDPSLAGLSAGLGNPGAFPTSVFADGGGWVMYFTGTAATEREAWEIWRATAPGPDGPWTRLEEPVLRRGPAAWDAGTLDFPSVLRTEDGYVMFYSAVPSTDRQTGAIGRATSDDGITWTKGVEPVIEPGLCGGFDDRATHQPRVVVQPDRLVMAYAGYAGAPGSVPGVGYADSIDGGLTWSCEWPTEALDSTGLPAGQVHTIAAFQRGERVALLVEWLSNGGTDVWLADLGLSAP